MSCLQNALKSLEKRSNFVLEKSGKPQSDFCTNPGTKSNTAEQTCNMKQFLCCFVNSAHIVQFCAKFCMHRIAVFRLP